MAKKEKVLEHTSALQQNRTDPDMKVKPTLIIHRIICYIVLIFFSILCLFFFYILLVNASRSHYDIMSGFSFLPGNQFINNFQSAISNTCYKRCYQQLDYRNVYSSIINLFLGNDSVFNSCI